MPEKQVGAVKESTESDDQFGLHKNSASRPAKRKHPIRPQKRPPSKLTETFEASDENKPAKKRKLKKSSVKTQVKKVKSAPVAITKTPSTQPSSASSKTLLLPPSFMKLYSSRTAKKPNGLPHLDPDQMEKDAKALAMAFEKLILEFQCRLRYAWKVTITNFGLIVHASGKGVGKSRGEDELEMEDLFEERDGDGVGLESDDPGAWDENDHLSLITNDDPSSLENGHLTEVLDIKNEGEAGDDFHSSETATNEDPPGHFTANGFENEIVENDHVNDDGDVNDINDDGNIDYLNDDNDYHNDDNDDEVDENDNVDCRPEQQDEGSPKSAPLTPKVEKNATALDKVIRSIKVETTFDDGEERTAPSAPPAKMEDESQSQTVQTSKKSQSPIVPSISLKGTHSVVLMPLNPRLIPDDLNSPTSSPPSSVSLSSKDLLHVCCWCRREFRCRSVYLFHLNREHHPVSDPEWSCVQK